MANVFPVTSKANFDIRSKYTRSDRKTSFVVGQYFKIRRRYASRDIVGMLRAWKVRQEDGVEKASRDADVNALQIGA
jgi:hypothetical protein